MDIVYAMPSSPCRLFVNVVHACPNACLFCVDFLGDTFFGFDLKNGRAPSVDEIISAVERSSQGALVKEIYFCGIGEPLLLYDRVVESAQRIRGLLGPSVRLAINTSGTFFQWDPRVDFVKVFDLVQVSLNAENEHKYDLICRPKTPGAYRTVMAFLQSLRNYIDQTGSQCQVELTVVDPSRIDRLPESERCAASIPRPDIDACRALASSLRWPLKVKELLQDFERTEWRGFASGFRDVGGSRA